jgi:hypothetical protein
VVGRKAGLATAWRPGPVAEVARVWDGAVAHSQADRWRLAGGKVLGLSTTVQQRMRWARGAEAGLTDVVA